MKRSILMFITWIAIAAMPTVAFSAEAEEKIRELVVDFNEAYLQNDLDSYFDYYADDATLWFNSGRTPLSGYKESWYKLIEGGGGVRKNSLSDIKIQMSPGGDAAIVTYRVDVDTQSPDGDISNTIAHETDVWFKTGNGWRIAHVHYTAERSTD
ncbi:MAG: nuclear transport factor 2 family protein [Woeseia sp.]